ncbi:MAG: type II toxin-antitoxin system VapB family antitoxin [Acidobacteria bacterium]|nr:type II toxin-antitoxin system VapB family antitoxin [Acidobacteriota bacterium]
MRTTARLDDRLLADAKRHAARSGRTLTSLIDEGLRDLLARRAAPPSAGRVTLPTGGRGGLQPGVSLESNAALLDVMDRES